PGTTLICIENTHNRAGGAVTSLSTMAEYRRVADKHGIALHMDGARAFNAAVALGVSIGDLLASVDSASLCLSKGLRSPVGSILVGSESLIDRARIWRKRLGGGMRQAGILAACGLVSLRTCVDRLAEDHAHCQRLAEAIGALPGLSTSPGSNPTNLCLIDTETEAAEWASRLHAAGVWCFPVASHRLRLVTHADVSSEDVEHAIGVFESLARG
ncbi:MAG TPA: GntG family PLP-dependent aldolase, partial [Fimbriimonas sp.]|nr:GntG family PLP-dependent aldolase [Fimbriimonas sp.]